MSVTGIIMKEDVGKTEEGSEKYEDDDNTSSLLSSPPPSAGIN